MRSIKTGNRKQKKKKKKAVRTQNIKMKKKSVKKWRDKNSIKKCLSINEIKIKKNRKVIRRISPNYYNKKIMIKQKIYESKIQKVNQFKKQEIYRYNNIL